MYHSLRFRSDCGWFFNVLFVTKIICTQCPFCSSTLPKSTFKISRCLKVASLGFPPSLQLKSPESATFCQRARPSLELTGHPTWCAGAWTWQDVANAEAPAVPGQKGYIYGIGPIHVKKIYLFLAYTCIYEKNVYMYGINI